MRAMTEKEAEKARGRDLFRMSPGALALALAVKYFGLFVYGTHASLVEVPSFVEVGGELFALAWAMTVALFGALAFAGVVHTWRTGRFIWEKRTTAILILAFTTYSVVLVVKGITTSDWDTIPFAYLPLILCGLPLIRYYELVAKKAIS